MFRAARFIAMVFVFALVLPLASPKANADEWDKKTVLTFSGPVQVGKTRLDAGTYVFKLADTYDRHIVQIFNQDENHLIATIMATPDYRLEPTDKTVVKFSETADNNNYAGTVPEGGVPVKEWFYPGDNFGQEFKVVAQPVEVAAVEAAPQPAEAESSEPAPQPEAQPAAPAPAPEEAAPEQTEPQTPDQSSAAPAAPAPQPAASEPEPAQQPQNLPKTASEAPLIAIAGALSLLLAGGVRAARKRG